MGCTAKKETQSGKLRRQSIDMETVPLKEYIEAILLEKDKAINIALAAAKEAVLVAETNAEKWRANANEWRAAMTDREKTFLPRGEFETYKVSTEKALSVEKQRGDIGQGKGAGLNQGWGYVAGVLGLLMGIYGILR